jgi:hypothetical protein
MVDIDKLERLARLRDDGTLTQDEFLQAKARLLTSAGDRQGIAAFLGNRLWLVSLCGAICLVLVVVYLAQQNMRGEGSDNTGDTQAADASFIDKFSETDQPDAGLAVAPLERENLPAGEQDEMKVQNRPVHQSSPTLLFGSGYGEHSVRVYSGPEIPLRLSSDQRGYRTRLREAYQRPINFGGSLVLMQLGCGTGCTFAYALDKSSGLVLQLPVGGEGQQALILHARQESALVWASWYETARWEKCKGQAWILSSRGFEPASGEISISCEQRDRLPSI